MKMLVLVAGFAMLVGGCAAYNELSPDPPLTPLERGYIELRNDQENFQLEKGEKYYIQFPGPARNQFYLVLATDKKWAVDQLLTRVFDPGEGPGERIADEAAGSDSLMVYPVDNSAGVYSWVIEEVRANVDLSLRYRYVPRWRYTFENRYGALQAGLLQNTVDRSTFGAIDDNFSFRGFDFRGERSRLDGTMENLLPLHGELGVLEKLFPPEIVNSSDTAYQKYRALKSGYDDELAFQRSYARVLMVFEKLEETRGRTREFLQATQVFTEFAKEERMYPARINGRVRRELADRLAEVVPFYDSQVRGKRDLTRMALEPPTGPVTELYGALGIPPPAELAVMVGFTDRFNVEVGALQAANARLRRLETLGGANVPWTSDSLYVGLIAAAGEAARLVPTSQLDRFERYGSLPVALQLRAELARTGERAAAFRDLYQGARLAGSSIAEGSWQTAESILRDLHSNQQFAPHPPVHAQKERLVREFEEEIAAGVLRVSRRNAEEFSSKNELTLENVPGLYMDTAFTPVYVMTFSGAGQGEVARRNKDIRDQLDQIQYVRFPENAIRGIHRELTSAPEVRGVEKARAIVEHGRKYRGKDKQILAIIDECNVEVPKWITRAKEYRRLYALPVTQNKQGSNEYMFRIRLQIPSEAQFPVYDVNLKLPKEVAQKAGTEQWFDQITINAKPIRNEGRFRITSPTADNGYESLITPVQMDKAGKNILEIRFRYPGFRVFEVSAMAQVPIIRKN